MSSAHSILDTRPSGRDPLNPINVTLEYPDGEGTIKAVDAVSVSVRAGQMISLVGPSGSDEPTAALNHERSSSIVRLLRRITDDFMVATSWSPTTPNLFR